MTTLEQTPPAQASEDSPVEEVDVAIVGSGFSGLGMAIRLKQSGNDDFVVFERAEEVGGTWWHNTYPGCGCDIPSNLYSFSFAPNPSWGRTYSLQPEIRDYLRRCADRFGVRPHIRFNTEVTGAAWSDDDARWHVETTAGPVRARVLVSAAGPLHEPKWPEIPGLDNFEGRVFHSAQWDHDHELTGRRVASIGTGASAIQYVPEIQPEVEQLHVFQRTPPWVMPHTDRPTKPWERRLYRAFPALQKLSRAGVYLAREWLIVGFVKNPRLMKVVEQLAKRHMRSQISDPELLEKVTPDYTPGCKRILPSNKWYPALAEDNVEVVTDGIREVRPNAVVTEDGTEREVDTIILGTGFRVVDMPIGKLVRGRDGAALDDSWQGSPRAHLGSTVPGFPNFFLMLGPNTGLGHNSIVYMIESQIAYVMDALRVMREQGVDVAEVRPEAAERFNERIEERMEGTVWTTGCASWYLDDTGRNPTIWPDWTFRFRKRLSRFNPAEYELRRAPVGAPA